MQIRKAVIPAAGLGTRFLPVTKAVPKELLPIIDRPLLHYVIAEAVEAGVEEVIIVTSPGKASIGDYFRSDPELEQRLADNSDAGNLALVKEASDLARVSFVTQHQALGLGHAVLMAKDAVGDEPFVVVLPDDIIAHSPGAISQMVQVSDRLNAGVIAVEQLPWEVIHNYGVVDGVPESERVHKIRGLVEKPSREEAPSNLSIVGRYILPPQIFQILENTRPGAIGEIQLTDALVEMITTQELYAYRFQGRRFDGGTPMGLLKASLAFGLERADTREDARALLRELQGQED
ncbi:MAG TPA: UTP--glucose-1-phosphate uridylyltransferase [Dehalococcoidia bacterium]|nr:UTP--glucose-1-phosphate uridylyltransferase [Dehalococcoidia bacterium]